jgi:hypothetical protein
VLLGFAAELEAERDHVVRALSRDPEAELAEAERSRDTPDFEVPGKSFEALAASATFDRVLYDGGEFGTATEVGSLEEEDYLGLPGLLDPDQVAVLLRNRQSRQLTARSAAAASSAPVSPASAAPAPALSAPAPSAPAAAVSREGLAALRKELNGLVGAWSHRTGQPHGVIHAELRQACGGPAIPQASADQIRDRIAMIRKWALSRR